MMYTRRSTPSVPAEAYYKHSIMELESLGSVPDTSMEL